MDDKYEAWFVDVADNEKNLSDGTIIWAADKPKAIEKADEWARAECQVVGRGLLILRLPGEPGNVHARVFDPLMK